MFASPVKLQREYHASFILRRWRLFDGYEIYFKIQDLTSLQRFGQVTLFANKYRIESARLKNWDYSSNGAYYITICVKDRECVFGNTSNGKIILSDIGKTAENCWCEIPRHFPFVNLDEYVIMPNHIHGIIIIEKPMICNVSIKPVDFMGIPVETQDFASLPTQQPNVPNETHATQQTHATHQSDATQQSDATKQSNEPSSNFGPQSKNIASIIRGFKIGVTKYAVKNNIPFEWQSRYYDHVIRDENDLNRIRKYIIENPSN